MTSGCHSRLCPHSSGQLWTTPHMGTRGHTHMHVRIHRNTINTHTHTHTHLLTLRRILQLEINSAGTLSPPPPKMQPICTEHVMQQQDQLSSATTLMISLPSRVDGTPHSPQNKAASLGKVWHDCCFILQQKRHELSLKGSFRLNRNGNSHARTHRHLTRDQASGMVADFSAKRPAGALPRGPRTGKASCHEMLVEGKGATRNPEQFKLLLRR